MTDGLPGDRRRKVFAALVAAQDGGLSITASRLKVAAQFGLIVEMVEVIEREGLKAQWGLGPDGGLERGLGGQLESGSRDDNGGAGSVAHHGSRNKSDAPTKRGLKPPFLRFYVRTFTTYMDNHSRAQGETGGCLGDGITRRLFDIEPGGIRDKGGLSDE